MWMGISAVQKVLGIGLLKKRIIVFIESTNAFVS